VLDRVNLPSIDDLQMKYIAALDRRDLDAWLECFAPEASYVCITRENHDAGLPVAMMLDDTRARLKDRVKFVKEVWSGTFEDYATRHFVQRIDSSRDAGGRAKVSTNFMVSYTNRRGGSDILVTGVYEDEIDLGGAEPRFISKRAILDTVTTPRYLVYPV
jgi:3-phenylpropionate/cinnamic acid dioxygenase small subunit